MSATLRSLNWTSVTWTPSGSPVVLTGVQSVAFDTGGSLLPFSGDGDRAVTTLVNDFFDPSCTITFANVNAASSLVIGQTGTLTATLNDAKNKAATGGGALIYTLSNAMIENVPQSGSHRQYGSASVSIKSFSTDGATNQLSIAAA
jgi:hypothetical protein